MRNLHITQASPKSPPIVDVSLTCAHPGCWARLVLPRWEPVGQLDAWAAYHGWHRGAHGDDRCPKHRPAVPTPAVLLSPLDTAVDVASVVAAAAQMPVTGYPDRPAHVMPPRSHDGTYLLPTIDPPNGGA